MPTRTCIACRRREEQALFFRVARPVAGGVTIWSGSGRSAYICRSAKCIEAALAKGRLERALKCAVPAEEREALREELICKLR